VFLFPQVVYISIIKAGRVRCGGLNKNSSVVRFLVVGRRRQAAAGSSPAPAGTAEAPEAPEAQALQKLQKLQKLAGPAFIPGDVPAPAKYGGALSPYAQ